MDYDDSSDDEVAVKGGFNQEYVDDEAEEGQEP